MRKLLYKQSWKRIQLLPYPFRKQNRAMYFEALARIPHHPNNLPSSPETYCSLSTLIRSASFQSRHISASRFGSPRDCPQPQDNLPSSRPHKSSWRTIWPPSSAPNKTKSTAPFTTKSAPAATAIVVPANTSNRHTLRPSSSPTSTRIQPTIPRTR